MTALGKTPNNPSPVLTGFAHEITDFSLQQLKKGDFGFYTAKNRLIQIARVSDHQFIDTIRIVPDRPDSPYKMFGMVTNNLPVFGRMLTFNLTTVVEGKRHPALNASRFIEWCYKHFQTRYGDVQTIIANWQLVEESTNTHQYLNALAQGKNRVSAAKNTWSAKQFEKLGFSQVVAIQEVGPLQSPYGLEPPQVICYFRPKPLGHPKVITHSWVDKEAKKRKKMKK